MAVGAFLTVVLCIGDFITPQILGGNKEMLLPQAVMMQIQRQPDLPLASVMSLMLTVIVAAVFLVWCQADADGAGVRMAAVYRQLGCRVSILTACYMFILLPVAVLILFSFQDGRLARAAVQGPEPQLVRERASPIRRMMDGLVNSLLVGLGSACDRRVVLGFPGGLGSPRYGMRRRGRSAARA